MPFVLIHIYPPCSLKYALDSLKKSLMIDLHQFYKLWISILAADFIKWTWAILILFCYSVLFRTLSSAGFHWATTARGPGLPETRERKATWPYPSRKRTELSDESPAYSPNNKFKKETLMYTKTLPAHWPLRKARYLHQPITGLKKNKNQTHILFLIQTVWHFWL